MIKIGDLLFNEIESNEYLHTLFNRVTENYSYLLIDRNYDVDLTGKEKIDALRFADILSKCSIETKKDRCFNLSQALVTMLSKIYPEDDMVKHYLGSILTNVNNYFGLSNISYEYINADFLEYTKEYIEKENFAIPNTQGGYFINKQLVAYNRMRDSECFSFSAPTSLGKTFVIRMFIKDCILRGEKANFTIVVPTNALINEIYNNIISDLKENINLNGYKVVKSPASIVGEDDKLNYIMIYTQERLLHHLIKLKDFAINYLFIDEAHKISISEGRSAFFYKIMSMINKYHNEARVYFSSPNIPNPQVYLDLVNENLTRTSSRISYSPVNQNKLILDKDSQKVLYYSEIDRDFHDLKKTSFIWKDSFIEVINRLGEGKSNIVFCNTKKEAVVWAKEYSFLKNEIINDEINELVNDIKEEIHDDCYLIDALKKGVAYHVAYIPTRIKEKIEHLFKKGIIKTVFCTSTLLEGVNFPAENLFLMLKADSVWLKDKARVDFKNLVGRVGRIEYNMFGNIFFISDSTTIDRYKKAVNLDVEEQTLSINVFLSDSRKREIVRTLLNGETTLSKNGTYEELNFARGALNMLLKEIVNNNKGKVYKAFEKFITQDDELTIKNAFKDNKYIQDDLSTTADQIETIDNDIIVNSTAYPNEFTYYKTLAFLEKMYYLFNWKQYESKSGLGKIACLRYFAVILQQWILGMGIKQIITATISWHRETKQIFIDGRTEPYRDTIEQRNYIINDVLNTLENIIQFKIKNYFLKFSERKIALGQELGYNDWYEFVEYGSCNYIVISLQKLGFSRESALYIHREHREKIKIKDGKLVALSNSLDKFRKINKEVIQIKYNNHKLFVDF